MSNPSLPLLLLHPFPGSLPKCSLGLGRVGVLSVAVCGVDFFPVFGLVFLKTTPEP